MRLKTILSFSLAIALCSVQGSAEGLSIGENQPLFTSEFPFRIRGTSATVEGTPVTITISGHGQETIVRGDGSWEILWSRELPTGLYDVVASTADGSTAQAVLRVQHPGRLPRQPPFDRPLARYDELVAPDFDAASTIPDRWRISPPPYELDENRRARLIGNRGGSLDPYNRNFFKGDLPIHGDDTFLVLTGVSDSLAESRTVPTPSGVSSARPSSFRFFGSDQQSTFLQTVIVSADLFQGDTAFRPIDQRVKATMVANINHVRVQENGILKPDVRSGSSRTDHQVSLHEFFYETKLRDLSPNFDFVSIRLGSQPFSSDFKGFIFSDTNLGVRLFGNYAANRFQYNLAVFDRLEKDTNSGLNRIDELRDQRVAIANLYWQDFLRPGYTQQFSLHHVRDEASLTYDRNGFLIRPAPVGDAKPHTVWATYLGAAGFGHFGRLNVDHALYYVFGRDSLNPIAGTDPQLRSRDAVFVSAFMAAVEFSYDRDWLRPRFALFHASGDDDPRDRTATGFDSINDSPNFAGGGFSFFNRLGIRLAGSGVALVERGSLHPSLRSNKEGGQPNFVNPGLSLVSLGLDVDVTPRVKAVFTGNYIRLDSPRTLEQILFRDTVNEELGVDLSAGVRYRPYLNNNVVVVAGGAAFLPGSGFRDLYSDQPTLYHFFTNLILTF